MTERDERALREALRGLEATDPVDPAAARRGAAERRRNRQTLAGIVTVLVLVVGVVGLPSLLSGSGPEATSAGQADSGAEGAPAGGAATQEGPESRKLEPTGAVPHGWRTEYYRDISFQVPQSWGYAVPPQSDWCLDEPRGRPRADQRRPYVWLGSGIAVRAIRCPEPRPRSLLSEHVEAISPGPAVSYAKGAVRQGDWWVVTRFAGSAVLTVTTQDRDLAEQILDSARVAMEDAPCTPSSPIAGTVGTRPEDVTDLDALGPVDRVVLCQYEPVADQGDVNLPRLRAVTELTGSRGQGLVTALASAPANEVTCDPPLDGRPDLAVLAQIWAGGESHRAYVNPAGCAGGMTGGIDDGTTVRVLSRQACQRLLTPPVAMWIASGEVARNCLR